LLILLHSIVDSRLLNYLLFTILLINTSLKKPTDACCCCSQCLLLLIVGHSSLWIQCQKIDAFLNKWNFGKPTCCCSPFPICTNSFIRCFNICFLSNYEVLVVEFFDWNCKLPLWVKRILKWLVFMSGRQEIFELL
jgi:hypothetical protein